MNENIVRGKNGAEEMRIKGYGQGSWKRGREGELDGSRDDWM